MIDGWGISCVFALLWLSLDFTDDQPTLVQVMAWCRQATSHYLSQCWPRSMSPNGVTRPQWVNYVAITSSSKGPFPYVARSESLLHWGLYQVDGILTTTFWTALSMMPYGITKPQWVNPLHAIFLRGNKNIFIFHVIPPHWFDTCSSNPSSSKTRTHLFYIVSIMAADFLATWGRASTTMILT